MSGKGGVYKVEWSAILTVIGIIILFSGAVVVTLLAPGFIESSWREPTTPYQVQMYEVSDPNLYISSTLKGGDQLQYIYHIRKGYSLLAFPESSVVRLVAPSHLEKYITREDEKKLKLTTHLLLVRPPQESKEMLKAGKGAWNAVAAAKELREKEREERKTDVVVYELFEPGGDEAFAVAPTDGFLENWVSENYEILDKNGQYTYQSDPGVIYIVLPVEYRVSKNHDSNGRELWDYDPEGAPIKNLEELKRSELGFLSRAQLISLGETIYAEQGCWYCHTDQTRTLVQDVVLNGSDSFPAPPSSPSEYIYQRVTFPGTHRIGPDLSRVGIKRPSRDWHKSHFWSPKTESPGSIMPSFQFFFDSDPRGTGTRVFNLPNWRFEAIFQYLMTKGTRITAPTEAWWEGKDPIQTIEIIEGRKRL